MREPSAETRVREQNDEPMARPEAEPSVYRQRTPMNGAAERTSGSPIQRGSLPVDTGFSPWSRLAGRMLLHPQAEAAAPVEVPADNLRLDRRQFLRRGALTVAGVGALAGGELLRPGIA